LNFDYPGYALHFIQRDRVKDGSDHLCSYVYKFHSPKTGYHYIVRAEYHRTDVFTVKFYCKKDRGHDYKYGLIINKGDLGNVIMTAAKTIPMLLTQFPSASFAFAAARSYDPVSRTVEPMQNTQRYRLYCGMVPVKFGQQTFSHHTNDEISSYLLYNRDSSYSLHDVQEMFRATYNDTDWI
jgi:hypothetical protein